MLGERLRPHLELRAQLMLALSNQTPFLVLHGHSCDPLGAQGSVKEDRAAGLTSPVYTLKS